MPLIFTDEFRKDVQKQTQWRAFTRKSKPENVSEDFDFIVDKVEAFLLPLIESERQKKSFASKWFPNEQWQAAVSD